MFCGALQLHQLRYGVGYYRDTNFEDIETENMAAIRCHGRIEERRHVDQHPWSIEHVALLHELVSTIDVAE